MVGICSFFLAGYLFAEPNSISLDSGYVQLTDINVMSFIDQSGDLDIESIDTEIEFSKPSSSKLNFGQRSDVVWLKMKVDPQNYNEPSFFLFQKFQFVGKIDLFYKDSEGNFINIAYDKKEGISKRPFQLRTITFEVPTPKETTDIYIRADSGGNLLVLDMHVASKKEFIEYTSEGEFGFGLFYGAILIMCLYNTFLWVSTRESIYGYYVYYVITLMLVFIYLNGYAHTFFNFPAIYERYFIVFLIIVYHAMILFTRKLLDIKSSHPKHDKYYLVLQNSILAISLLAFVFFPQYISAKISAALTPIIMVSLIYAGVIKALQRVVYAYYFLFGWGFILVSAVGSGLITAGIIQKSALVYNALQLSALWELTMFSLAVARKSKEYKEMMNSAKNISQENQRLSAYYNSLIEDERAEISRHLHDSVSSHAVTLKLWIDNLKNREVSNMAISQDEIVFAEKQVNTIYDNVRSVSRSLRPESLDVLGISSTIEMLVNDNKVAYPACDISLFISDEINRLPNEVVINIYRIVQEALTNINKHAKATLVTILIQSSDDEITILIRDNGVGIKDLSNVSGIGLISMKARANQLHGTFNIDSDQSEGTSITVRFPDPISLAATSRDKVVPESRETVAAIENE